MAGWKGGGVNDPDDLAEFSVEKLLALARAHRKLEAEG